MKISVLTKLFTFTFLWSMITVAGAQNNSSKPEVPLVTGDTVTVIATKTPKAPLNAPASVSLIPREEVQAFIAQHPFKVLNLTEGVWPRAYRGLADYWARPIFRGHRALIMVDGLNWYDYGYYYHTGAIPLPDLERVEVVRGPYSALYGTMAQTAVINYLTRIPQRQEVEASAAYGSWDSRFYSVRFADRPFRHRNSRFGNAFFYSLSFKTRNSDGYVTTPSYKTLKPLAEAPDPTIPVVSGWKKDIDPRSGKERFQIGDQGKNWYKDYGLFFKTGLDFGTATRVWYSLNVSEFKYGWKDGRSALRDSSGKALYDGSAYLRDGNIFYPITVTSFLFTSDPRQKKSVVHTLHFNHSIPNKLDMVALFGLNDKESAAHYVSKGRYKVEDNYLAQFDLTATLHLRRNTLLVTGGLQGVQEQVTVTDHYLADRYDPASRASVRERTRGKNRTLAAYLQAEYSPLQFLTAYLGARYDHWWGTDADYYANISGVYYTKYPDTNKGKFSPKVSLVFRPRRNGTVRVSYGEAFTAPSLYYRTASYYWEGGGTISMAKPNPDLKPTTNRSYEIGTEWTGWNRRARVKITYFHNDFRDLIVNKETVSTLPDGTELKLKQRVNAEEALVKGLEAAVEALLTDRVQVGLYYTHHWSEYTKTQAPSKLGWEVNETPTDLFSARVSYLGRLFEANVSYRYADRRYDNRYAPYASNTYKADDPYHLVDAKLSFRPMTHLTVSVAVDNLLDYEYYEYYRAPGRFWLISTELAF